MPPHRHGYADEWYWEDLPASAKKAATLLGYTQDTWDAAEKVAYHQKDFENLTYDEKRAAVYLGRNPLDYKLKNVKWDTIQDENMKKHAKVLGWDEHKWNKNWPVHDVDVYQYGWSGLSEEQKKALTYFGYNQNLWDQTGNEETFQGGGGGGAVPASKPSKGSAATSSSEEKKDDDDKKKKKKKPVPFSQSPAFGGTRGTEFDDGNHMHIHEITVAADANMVHGIAVKYVGKECKHGSIGQDNTKTFKLRNGEFITSAKVTSVSRNGVVSSVTFFTNRGQKLGPCGEEKGNEDTAKAQDGAVLCGLHGRAGKHINALGFKWGPNPKA